MVEELHPVSTKDHERGFELSHTQGFMLIYTYLNIGTMVCSKLHIHKGHVDLNLLTY